MVELPLPEDEAALYVMGELSPAERSGFEARLAQSAELRTLVRELQEGAVALAMAAPRRKPPSFIWPGIAKAVREEGLEKAALPAFWSKWWRNGWAAAAACLVGWFVYALWNNRPVPAETSPQAVALETHPQTAPTVAESPGAEQILPAPSPQVTNTTYQLLQARARENEALRQILDLKNQMSHLSESLAVQQALLAEPNRLRFFQLTEAFDASEEPVPVQLSPALQHAISSAMAREVGWVPLAGLAGDPGVDFVDFRPITNGTQNAAQMRPRDSTTQPAPETAATSAKGQSAGAPAGTIPAFVSGNNIVVAVDSTIVPSGSHLTFSTASDNDEPQTVGTADVRDNPVVATVPGLSATGGTLTITARTASGDVRVFRSSIPRSIRR